MKVKTDHVVQGGKLTNQRLTNEAAAAGYNQRVFRFSHEHQHCILEFFGLAVRGIKPFHLNAPMTEL